MIEQKVTQLLNKQVNNEFYSAYLYLDFANYYADEGLDGFHNWFKIQAMEERDHAMLFIEYMQNNGIPVVLDTINKPNIKIADHLCPLEEAYKHEQFITASIYNIYSQCVDHKDYRTQQFLDWFVKEQGEEERNADDLIKKYTLFGKDSKGLYALNNELKARIYSAPSLVLD